ncbi:hypothetical protein DSO57_1003609 [Entomophthora muscae]|uniref:Uncharacterized protein n=1 Tax=Entomophthora muscae TaxID=34485 RepID=A0ACC2TWA0_9FUNG|nr:hypothetical protein DSO57_1003609 [Entomophthora muscae]
MIVWPSLLSVRRVGLLGWLQFGVHVNGYTHDSQTGELKLWVARRSPTKATWPNYLDNTCAGGISHGDGIFETVVKECHEEGNIPKELVSKARSAGAVTYTSYTSLGVSPETQYVYDLELPASFVPAPNDGEVGAFYLMGVDEAISKLKEGEFKPNCGMVIIDFLIRHGLLDCVKEPNIALIQARCHRPSPFYPF